MTLQNKITYHKELDERFRYDGSDLGVTCREEGTIFKVWSPLAHRITLRLFEDGETQECVSYEMTRLRSAGAEDFGASAETGVWQLCLPGNLHGKYYDYLVWQEGEEAPVRTADPYAVGCNCNGRRSMVVDLSRTDPEGFGEDKAPARSPEQIIYELHVKDFSYDPESGVPKEYRGKYKAFTVTGTNGSYPTCVEYLKKLGITHVHLLPIFDYGALDEAGSEGEYNWGYDPVNYNVPEGSYATDPYDGTVRIRECKEMVQALHKAGIRVIMDVVYNHTYSSDSWLERMVPGYYYRHWEDGSLSDGSACGNDIAAGRLMVDNYIVQSILFWAREYHIDGFRFDLMGLLTVELMNRIRRTLDETFGPGEKIIYGEPWRAKESPMEQGTLPPLKSNVGLLDEGISIFSDDTRDVIKGDVFHGEVPGFVNGGKNLEGRVLQAVTGWRRKEQPEKIFAGSPGFAPRSCSQVIQYVSAHDNFTLWDKLVLTMHGGSGYNEKHPDVMAANKLAALVYFTCQGNLFMQAGEEFGRTKLGDGNSFRSRPEINMLRWRQTREFSELVEYYSGLIRLRKRLPGLCDKSSSAAGRIFGETVHGEGLVSFQVDNSADSEREESWPRLFITYNALASDARVPLPEGKWVVLADEEDADCRKSVELTPEGQLPVKGRSGLVLGLTGLV